MYATTSAAVHCQLDHPAHHSPHPSLNFHRGGGLKKCEIWPRSSTSLAFEPPSFWNKVTYLHQSRKFDAEIHICRRDTEAGCARQPPVFLTSADRGLSLSAIANLLLLARVSGTVYLLTSRLLHHLQHSARNWKHTYSGNHTQTLFCNCFAIVVLEVIVT